MFVSSLHWGPEPSKNQFQKTHSFYTHPNGTLADDFHTYGMYWDEKQFYTYIDDDSNRVLQVNTSDISYWQRSGITDRENPWQYSPNKCAPFDVEFYLIINLAVGGTIGYFPDGLGGKPWKDSSPRASAEFYDNKSQWFKTWGPQSTFQIDSVKVWDLGGKEEDKQSLRKEVVDQ